MKTVTGISILANVVLAGVVFALLPGRRTEIAPLVVKSAPEITSTPAEPAASVLPAILPPRPDPFRWSQLESTDYRTYVANLRGIGCPEPTVRDIVTADVDEAIYRPQREKLKESNLSPALLNLKRGEEAFIASLLGTQPSPDGAAAAETVVVSTRPSRGPTEIAVAMPLVFQNVDPVVAGIDAKMIPVVDSIRQRFLKEIGSQQDPNDPGYRERWKNAQANADSQLRGMIGLRAYQAYQFRARRLAASSAVLPQNGNP